MSSSSVVVFTERPGFEAKWRATCEEAGLAVRSARPDELASVARAGLGLVLDAASTAYDEDELLASVGLAKALAAYPVVQLPSGEAMSGIEELLDDICGGLVTRNEADVPRFAAALSRRLERERERRFEFLTLSPRGGGELLAILGDGRCLLVPRPVDPRDDGSEILAIELAEDAGSARLRLAGGAEITVDAQRITSASAVGAPHVNGTAAPLPIDGARLGARLRELRLAAGLTQAELARRTGIHRPNIARVEAGRHTPSLETLARLASAIGVPTTRVLSES